MNAKQLDRREIHPPLSLLFFFLLFLLISSVFFFFSYDLNWGSPIPPPPPKSAPG